MRLVAETWVDAPPWAVFRFLSSLPNHWSLTDGFVRSALAGALDDGGEATIVISGPLRGRRVGRARIVASSPPAFVIARVEMDGGTRATVEWAIARVGQGAAVQLSVTVGGVRWRDRAVLTIAGRILVGRRLQVAVRHLRHLALVDAVRLERSEASEGYAGQAIGLTTGAGHDAPGAGTDPVRQPRRATRFASPGRGAR
jgi:hypothetical protein